MAIQLWLAFAALVIAQEPQFPPAFPPTPILPSSINYAPSVTPNVLDASSPDAQLLCPGYKASNVEEDGLTITADLVLAGPACNVYGNDIPDLTLSVEYQSEERLSVKIYPKYLDDSNRTQYILGEHLTPLPHTEHGYGGCGESDLKFVWTNEPSFQFQITRTESDEVLYSTYGTKIVFQDQFLELVTSMVPDYNIYGLAESLRGFRLPNDNFTQTFWHTYNLMNDQVLGVNAHSTHPVYLETRYASDHEGYSTSSSSHGVYARNAHGQDWVFKPDRLIYRTIGGSIDLYFLSGSTPKDVISQYQLGIVGTPNLQPYWALGFFQCRWGYLNWTDLQEVIDGYAAQGIQLEGVMNDLDYLKLNRDFTNSPGRYDIEEGRAFLDRLHAAGQYYLPILDNNIYVPQPGNASDAYATYDRGDAINAYLRNGEESYYIGVQWPGFSVFPDFLMPEVQQFWAEEIKRFQEVLDVDGYWIDVSDPTSFCTGSCGEGLLHQNPIHVPFALPGDPDTAQAVDYRYPEGFEVTNATEAASASSAMASQSAKYPMSSTTGTPVLAPTKPTPGVRNLNFPPYAINNFLPGHSLVNQVVSPNATHNDGPYNSTEYELHNLYGHLSANATYHGLLAARPNLRPWFAARSTFAGSGQFAGHWGGDTNSKWGNMYFGISQALQFSLAGLPYFGVETCGFNGNTDAELCARWMQLAAWFPLFRNHNNRNTIPQEAFRWASTAEATRRIMAVRYTLLPYTYTLFHAAHTAGAPVLRALAWEFPHDPRLLAIETQFLAGPAILVTPVLEPHATTVKGVFPGIGEGARWYDWYSLAEVRAASGENKTLEAPLERQPVHVRGGYVVPMQKPGNTTAMSRRSAWSVLVALDAEERAEGSLYLDDGVRVVQEATKFVKFAYEKGTFTACVEGGFEDGLPLANITIAGIKHAPSHISLSIAGAPQDTSDVVFSFKESTLRLTGLEKATSSGVWTEDVEIILE